MQEYTGIVLGGPWDGRVLSWNAPEYRVAVHTNPPTVFNQKAEDVVAYQEIETFDYTHFEYVNHPFWIPSAVLKRKAFDYHVYNHPMDFVIKKLVAGYNPGAR